MGKIPVSTMRQPILSESQLRVEAAAEKRKRNPLHFLLGEDGMLRPEEKEEEDYGVLSTLDLGQAEIDTRVALAQTVLAMRYREAASAAGIRRENLKLLEFEPGVDEEQQEEVLLTAHIMAKELAHPLVFDFAKELAEKYEQLNEGGNNE